MPNRTLRLALALMLAGWVATCTPAAPPIEASPQQPRVADAAPPAPNAPLPDPLAKPLEAGSQDARDDLYCAGVLIAAHPAPMEALVPVEQARVERGQTNALIIGETGIQKLIREGAAVSAQASQILNAWADVAGQDFVGGRLRLSVETCTQRAEAIGTPN
jgi:hypothetical protein